MARPQPPPYMMNVRMPPGMGPPPRGPPGGPMRLPPPPGMRFGPQAPPMDPGWARAGPPPFNGPPFGGFPRPNGPNSGPPPRPLPNDPSPRQNQGTNNRRDSDMGSVNNQSDRSMGSGKPSGLPNDRADRRDSSRSVHGEDDRGRKRKVEEGSNEEGKTLYLRGIGPRTTEAQIKDVFNQVGPVVQEVRIRKRKDGVNMDFAFVVYGAAKDAKDVLAATKGNITVDGRPLVLELSHKFRDDDHRDIKRERKPEGNWLCRKCNQDNFPHRGTCYQCNAPRAEASTQDRGREHDRHSAGRRPNNSISTMVSRDDRREGRRRSPSLPRRPSYPPREPDRYVSRDRNDEKERWDRERERHAMSAPGPWPERRESSRSLNEREPYPIDRPERRGDISPSHRYSHDPNYGHPLPHHNDDYRHPPANDYRDPRTIPRDSRDPRDGPGGRDLRDGRDGRDVRDPRDPYARDYRPSTSEFSRPPSHRPPIDYPPREFSPAQDYNRVADQLRVSEPRGESRVEPPPPKPVETKINDGSLDKTDVPTEFLLVRALEPFTAADSVLAAFRRLSGTVKDVRLVREKANGASCRFAFVEYANHVEATQALMDASGLTIDGKPVLITYGNNNSFSQPAGNSDAPGGGLQYWDLAYYGECLAGRIKEENSRSAVAQPPQPTPPSNIVPTPIATNYYPVAPTTWPSAPNQPQAWPVTRPDNQWPANPWPLR